MAAAAKPVVPIEVFYSYSHRDEDLRDELERHLSVLKRSGVIREWHDRKIDAGSEWAGRIDEHLNRAGVILLLISADFLASDYCYDVELKRAMERHEAGEAIVIPIILRPVDWRGAPFGKLQCLPTDARPVTSWPNRDEAFRNVAQGIRRAVAAIEASPAMVQERVLDAAIPSRVPVRRSTQLVTMIRSAGSAGLRGVLQIEEVFETAPEDVRSKPFSMEFPLDEQGELSPALLTLRVESTDFDTPQAAKTIRVPPRGDSDPCTFLLTAKRAGQLSLNLEVLHGDVTVAARLLRTNGEAAGTFVSTSAYLLASLPLTTRAYPAPVQQPVAAGPAAAPSPPSPKPASPMAPAPPAVPPRPKAPLPPVSSQYDPPRAEAGRSSREDQTTAWFPAPQDRAPRRPPVLAALLLLAVAILVIYAITRLF